MPDLIPLPSDVEMHPGYFTIPADLSLVCDSSFFGLSAFISTALEGVGSVDVCCEGRGDIRIVYDPSLEADGTYSLEVRSRGIEIAAGSYGGAAAAIATLGQMAGDGKVPASSIKDSPRFAWRGFMLDVSRHFFTVSDVKALLHKMAQYKFNKFHWHLTDDQGWRIDIKAYPELTSGGQFYTQDEIREVVAYAASLGIDVIPEIDMPGHSLKVIENYPHLSCGGKAGWGRNFSFPLCPGNDSTIAFAKAVYEEVFDLFPYPYVHIGADEVEKIHWKNCRKCRERMRQEGLADESALQAWFVSVMEAFFKENGRTMIGWDEISDGEHLSKDAVVQWWRPWAPAARMNAAGNGNSIILSPNEFYYLSSAQNRHSLMKVYRNEPLDEEILPFESQILGVHANLWTENIPTLDVAARKCFPLAFAVSEVNWTDPSAKDEESFKRRVMTHLQKLDEQGWNYRIPDLDGFCDINVYVDSAVVDVLKPFDGITVRYTLDGTEPGPDSPIYEKPLVIKEDCVVKFRPFTLSGYSGETASALFRKSGYIAPADVSDVPDGLRVRWYNGTFTSCADIPEEGYDAVYEMDTVGLPMKPENNIGLIFNGYIEIPEDGVWSFYTYTDDGSVMSVSGAPVVLNDGLHSRSESSGQAALKKGLHPLEIRYFDHGGGYLEAGFVLPDGTRKPFRFL